MKRHDGRSPSELRSVRIQTGVLPFAEGSCMIEMGSTRVLCAASVEERLPPWLRNSGRGWVTAEYSMLPRSTTTRTSREVQAGRPSGRTQEIQRLIGRSLRAVTDMSKLGERTITLDCDVIVADGGTRTASITGAWVALRIAAATLLDQGLIDASPVIDHVAAVSVGVVDGTPVLDLDYVEDVSAHVDMNLVMTGAGAFVEVQGTAEGVPFPKNVLDELVGLGSDGISTLIEAQRRALTSLE
jgi:ribonuclease PH